jgi:hypothetical protein
MSVKNTVRVNDIESFLLFGFFFHTTFLLFVVVFLHLARYFFVVSFCFVASCSLLFVVVVFVYFFSFLEGQLAWLQPAKPVRVFVLLAFTNAAGSFFAHALTNVFRGVFGLVSKSPCATLNTSGKYTETS